MSHQNKRNRQGDSPPLTQNKKSRNDDIDRDLNLLSVLEIKAELKQMNLKQTDAKSELIRRLTEVKGIKYKRNDNSELILFLNSGHKYE
jgi:hypothetical protein